MYTVPHPDSTDLRKCTHPETLLAMGNRCGGCAQNVKRFGCRECGQEEGRGQFRRQQLSQDRSRGSYDYSRVSNIVLFASISHRATISSGFLS